MNRYHRRYCGSARWARIVETSVLPWALEDVQLGDEVLELGPGPGVTTRLLARRVPRLTAVELDIGLAARLRSQLGGAASVVCGDAAALPFGSDRFSAVTCFTMLHHVPSPALQDRLFAEAFRVLRPGGRLAVSDVIADLGMDDATGADMAQWTGCIAGALARQQFDDALAAAGLVDVEIRETHRVHEHAGAAIIRATKPTGESCCAPVALQQCCAADAKSACCGEATTPPTSCGCTPP